ncbi:MAG: hypothetical protein ACR2H3_01455 [Acidimicrobiales bacterium]
MPAQSAGPTYTIYISDLNKFELTLPWTIPCPIVATTTTTSTSTTVPPTTTTTPVAATTLKAEPPLGPPGFVTVVSGTGFPAGPVLVRWEGGIGSVTANAAADGTFRTQLLVMPGDRIGPRAVVAKGGAVEQIAAFLVVPNTVSPSGRDVTQINRIRRLGNR